MQETSESVTLRSDDGAGFGFDIYGDASGAIAVQSLQSGGPAQQSGLIQPGESRTHYSSSLVGLVHGLTAYTGAVAFSS